MNKLTKGAIATAAGVILLMGGAGTLASWNSSAAAGASQAITAGSLSVVASSTVTPTWKSGTTTINPSTYKIVPGDTLTYSQTFNVTATGDNLLFTVGVTPGTFGSTTAGTPSAALAAVLVRDATFNVTGGSIAASTTSGTYKVASGSASTIVVSMTVNFPYGTAVDNGAQLGSVTLGTGAVTLTQTQTP